MTNRLTVCIIARDEEELLPGAIDSLNGIYNELVIVDADGKSRPVLVELLPRDSSRRAA